MALIKCSECGGEVSEKADVCPKCGCPIDISITEENERKKFKKKKTVKATILGTIVIIIFVIISFGIYKFFNRPDASGYYDGAKWGTSYSDMHKALGEHAIENDKKDGLLIDCKNYQENKDVSALISYGFKDDLLEEVTLWIHNGDNSSYTDILLLDKYVNEYDKLYGKHKEDGIKKIWNTKKSKIEISELIQGYITITYQDITKVNKK